MQQRILQRTRQGPGCAVQQTLAGGRHVQSDDAPVLAVALSKEEPGLFQLVDQIACRRLMDGQSACEVADLDAGRFRDLGERPYVRAADAAFALDVAIVPTHRLHDRAKLLPHEEHRRAALIHGLTWAWAYTPARNAPNCRP